MTVGEVPPLGDPTHGHVQGDLVARVIGLCGFCHGTYEVVAGQPRSCCDAGRKFDLAFPGEQLICRATDAPDAPNDSPDASDSNAASDASSTRSSTTSSTSPTSRLSELIENLLTERASTTAALSHLGERIGTQAASIDRLSAALSDLAASISDAIASGAIGDGDDEKLPTQDMEGNPIVYK